MSCLTQALFFDLQQWYCHWNRRLNLLAVGLSYPGYLIMRIHVLMGHTSSLGNLAYRNSSRTSYCCSGPNIAEVGSLDMRVNVLTQHYLSYWLIWTYTQHQIRCIREGLTSCHHLLSQVLVRLRRYVQYHTHQTEDLFTQSLWVFIHRSLNHTVLQLFGVNSVTVFIWNSA